MAVLLRFSSSTTPLLQHRNRNHIPGDILTLFTVLLTLLGAAAATCNDANCEACSAADTCMTCASDYELDANNACKLTCNDANCDTCSDAATCTTCKAGFGTCIQQRSVLVWGDFVFWPTFFSSHFYSFFLLSNTNTNTIH